MTAQELREAYINFFAKRGHKQIPSASLVPEHNPTVLFTTAGMHPLVPYLLGEPHPMGKRLVNVQKVLRTDDIDEVGDTTHNTFFEMLGNWSLGDYWKEEAIAWSYELLIKEFKVSLDRFAVTVFEGDSDAPRDEESIAVWKKLGIPQQRIVPRPKKDNWWGPVGQAGPCGPDTEMFVWSDSGKPESMPNEDPRWVEVWNNVFMQYNKETTGTYRPLTQKNVDTGMGLERMLMILQGKESVYETDVLNPIFQAVEKRMKTSEIRLIRLITDHVKAAVFLIADGIKPSNTERGYILRRLIRRAIRSAHRSGMEEEWLKDAAETTVKLFSPVYPELSPVETIINTLQEEQERFKKPLNWIEQYRYDLQAASQGITKKIANTSILIKPGVASGRYVFENYQSYGVPPDMAEDVIRELNIKFGREEFEEALRKHQQKSRTAAAGRFAGGLVDHSEMTTRGHTTTHLLHQALRDILDPSVHQTGSNITPDRIRFDFFFDRKLTNQELKKIEERVNQKIQENLPVRFEIMPVNEAKETGAIGLFDEKYLDRVKVYFIGDYSKEFCGGPHVSSTGVVGRFTITKETAAGKGNRRIYATLT